MLGNRISENNIQLILSLYRFACDLLAGVYWKKTQFC